MSVRSVGSFGLAEASGGAGCHSPFTGKCLLIILPTSTDRKVSLPALTVSPDSLLLCLSDLTVTTFFIIFNLNFPCCRLILLLLLSSAITSRLADSISNMKQGSKQGLFLRVRDVKLTFDSHTLNTSLGILCRRKQTPLVS